MAESSSTSKKINQALGSQLRILTEQQGALSQQAGVLNQQFIVQKQQWDKENQRPAILVITGIEAPLSPGGSEWRELTPRATLATGHTLGPDPSLEAKIFFVRNVGNDWLRRAQIAANVVSPAHFKCVTYSLVGFGTQNPCDLADRRPPDLPPDPDKNLQPKNTDLRVTVYFSVPNDMEVVPIYLTLSGDNLLGGETYSIWALR